tara:strand:+ start:396 stop:821 length:426 start_codon:yes stop_codon:yes gene_type:complete
MSNLANVHPSWLKKDSMSEQNVDFAPVLEKTWLKLDNKTKAHLAKPRPGMFGKKLETSNAHDLAIAAAEEENDNIRIATDNYINNYFKRPPPAGGWKTKKYKKSRKSIKSRKSRKSKKGGGYRTVLPTRSCPFKEGKLLSN